MKKESVNNAIDDEVDEQIFSCLNPASFKSFFLFAGAGSGKTRSLVNVLAKFKDYYGLQFRISRQKIAIITYTNAAADEISRRLKHDQIFSVSTIHSFCWTLIQNFTNDIREWVKKDLSADITELIDKQGKSRDLNNPTSRGRARSIESKQRRLSHLDGILKFTYNPNGDNVTKDSLNHSEVISITADFIVNQSLMQEILICRHPIILVDESQDTKKALINALFILQAKMASKFSLGLFGDTMQRIYSDGKEDLGRNLPHDWLQPSKLMNHRSNKRIINLVNDIRKGVDGQKQIARSEKLDGHVRMFISGKNANKTSVEQLVAKKMMDLTKDPLWHPETGFHKALILEHHMAANRMGFSGLFKYLHGNDKLKTGFLDGTLAGINFFRFQILPLIDAIKSSDKFSIARIVKQYSTFLNKNELQKKADQIENIRNANAALSSLLSLWNDKEPILIDILRNVTQSGLFPIPDVLYPLADEIDCVEPQTTEHTFESGETDESEVREAWENALLCSFSELKSYNRYIMESSKFGTHQGVKGLEYPRVMVIIDDEESKGFLFSYDKLFGAKELSKEDKKNIEEGRETGIDRTRRLFYVACSRAKESLAIVAYTDNPEIVRENLLRNSWFSDNEIEII